jgi:hypothetical protein
MSAVATTFHPAVTSAVLSGSQWSPTVRPAPFLMVSESPDLMLHVGISDFDLHFAASLIDVQTAADYSEVIIKAFIDQGVSARLTLRNEPATGANEPLQIKEVSLNFDVTENRPRPLFFSDSLYAALGLAGSINISMPELGMDVGVHFSMPLSGVSTLLQRRQIYFGLMVIERATGLKFEIPEFIPGEDIDAIAFTYHAVVARDFRWLCNEVTLMPPATKEILIWLNNLPTTEPGGIIYRVMFGPAPKSRTIFGQTVALGDETVFLDDAVIQNREEVLRRLAVNDEQIVPVTFRPLSRKGRYVLPNAPRMPNVPWDERLVGCINLEDTLNERLAARYHELAASTLAGLTPEEIKAVTERPVLDEDAHLIGD